MMAPLAEAWAALASGDAAAALALAERHALPSQLPWRMLRARAGIALGDTLGAEALLRAAGDALPARLLLAQLLFTHGRAEEALAALPREGAQALMARLGPLIMLGRIAEAREDLSAAIPLAERPRQLEHLFHQAGRVLGHGLAHADATRQVSARLPQIASCALEPAEAEAALRLRARLDFTLGDWGGFPGSAAAALAAEAGGRLAPLLAAALDPPATPRPRVFVVGLSKTGTSSMHDALVRLGLVAAHWAHPLSNLLLRPSDAVLIEAMSDSSVADAVEVLAARHPDARFILTLRPIEDWLRSMAAHFGRHHGAHDFAALRALVETPDRTPHGVDWQTLHRNLYTRHADFRAAFAAHTARVAAVFRDTPKRLMHFNVFAGDGYPKLCAFLGLPMPDEAFPHSNAAPRYGNGEAGAMPHSPQASAAEAPLSEPMR
jgi:hypothetical protein